MGGDRIGEEQMYWNIKRAANIGRHRPIRKISV